MGLYIGRRDNSLLWLLSLYYSIIIAPFSPFVILLFIAILALIPLTKNHYKVSIKSWPEVYFLVVLCTSIIGWAFYPTWLSKLEVWGQKLDWLPTLLVPVFIFTLYFFLSLWLKHIAKPSWQELEKIYIRFWLAGLFIVLIIVLQFFHWNIGFDKGLYILDFYDLFRNQDFSARAIGTSGNSNIAGGLLICFIQISLYAFFISKKISCKLLSAAVFIIYCTALWLTGSRGAFIGLIFGLIVQLWMTNRKRIAIGFTLSLVTLLICYPEIIPRNETLKSNSYDRWDIWMNSMVIFKKNWLVGVLPLNFSQEYNSIFGKPIVHAHNIFLGVASEYGIICFIVFMALISITIYRARCWIKLSHSNKEQAFGIMLLAHLISIMGHGCYDYPIVAPQIGLIFILSIIIINIQYVERCGHTDYTFKKLLKAFKP